MDYKKIEIFLEFLIFGVILGLIEDLIIIKATTDATITLNTLGIVFLVTLPFAVLGELIIDRIEIVPRNSNKWMKRIELFGEFLIFGIVVGVVEDVLAVILSTGASFSWKMLIIIVLITIPFAILGELVVDRFSLFEKKKIRFT